MSPIQAVAIAVRLFALWLALYCARWAPYLYGVVRDAGDTPALVLGIAAVVFYFGVVLTLWFFPRTVARSLVAAGDSASVPTAGPTAWLNVGCTLLGLWVLTTAVPSLSRHLYLYFYAKRENISVAEGWGANTVYIVVEIAIATWLLLGASGLRKVVSWARNAPAD